MRYSLLLLAALPSLALAQSVSGPAAAIDGDTLDMTGMRIRLHGIDAPEGSQDCRRGNEAWACGAAAKGVLARLIAGQEVRCEQHEIDDYGRAVATCYAGRRNLNQALVAMGMAVAFTEFSDAYAADEARAKAGGLGIWAGEFERPQAYRRAHPDLYRAPPRPRPAAQAVARPHAASAGGAFRNCAEARAAGRAPLYRGQPGYGAHMDGDGDGVACEPYRGR